MTNNESIAAMPLVSVIITTYKNEHYLPRAVESVLTQTYPHIELIVVDDNAPESAERGRTEAVMARYPTVRYLRHAENKNGAAARNTGIRAAGGDYIAFLDNDDFYFSAHIADCVRALCDHADCDAVLTGVAKIRGGLVWETIIPKNGGNFAHELLFSETALGTGSNLFLRASQVREMGGFDERFRRHQDVEFGLRCFSVCKAHILPRVSIIKEMDGNSNVPDFPRFLETKALLWKTFSGMLSALTEEERRQYDANQYASLLYTACKSGDIAHITYTKEKLLALRPLSKKEKLLIFLGARGGIGLYEKAKFVIKARKSAARYASVTEDCDARDIARLDAALKQS